MFIKITNQKTKEVQVFLGSDKTYAKENGFTEGEAEQAYNGGWYLKGFAPPAPEPTPQEKITALEARQTSRLLREAALGEEYAVAKLAEIDAEIQKLRKLL